MSFPPLTCLLRRGGWRDDQEIDQVSTYHEIAQAIESQNLGAKDWKPVKVHQKAPTLFGPLDRSYLRKIFDKKHPNFNFRKKTKGWMYAKDLPPVARRSLISRLFWIKRCKKSVQSKIYRLASTDTGWVQLRIILVSCEMRMNTIILAMPNKEYSFFDRINASLVSNSINQKNFHKFLKSVIKKCRKAILEGSEPVVPRSCSWINEVLREVKGTVATGVKQLTLLQTRAAGYPTQEIREDSLQAWIDTVTDSTEADLNLLTKVAELEDYVNKTMRINAFTVRETHVSLGEAGCFETSRSKGGKKAHASSLLSSGKEVLMIDLNSGEFTEIPICKNCNPGEYLFHDSLARYKVDRESILRVRVSGIDEVGMKYRIVTVPTFPHSTILSPWAHLTYQFLKTSRETKSGVSGSSHAWEMSIALTASDPQASWLFTGKKVQAFISDLDAATDNTYHKAIICIMEVAKKVMPIQDWYGEVITDLLSSSRAFILKKGGEVIEGITSRGVFMGDHGSKTILTLSGLYALSGMSGKRISRLVGDDQATVSQQPAKVASVYRERMESLGYKLSEDDTCVSDRVFFTENCFEIPTDPSLTTEVWLSRKGRSNLPFQDVPPVKILSDAGKDQGLFSETAIGKITLLGKKMEETGKTFREGTFHLASWIQDICIGTLFRKEFIYFPRFLVSTGKPPLFGDEENFFAFVRMHRCGRLKESYASIMRCALAGDIFGTGRYLINTFLTHNSGDQSIRVVDKQFDDEEFNEALLFQGDAIKGFESFLVGRLGSKIISESEITAKMAERESLLGVKPITRRMTVTNLAKDKEPLTQELLTEFSKRWKSNSHLLRVRRKEKYYDREVVEQKLGMSHPLRVKGILQPLPLEDKALAKHTERDREVQILYDWVKSNPSGLDDIPRALIRDDLVALLGKNLTRERLIIVTDDRNLVSTCASMRQTNWRESRQTFNISIKNWIRGGLLATNIAVGSPPVWSPDEIFVDMGSMDGYLDNHPEADVPEVPSTLTSEVKLVRPTRGYTIPEEFLSFQSLRDENNTVPEI